MTETTPAATSAEQILDVATGYMGAKQLFAASRIGVFSALANGPKTAGEIAAAVGRSERVVRILADAMNSLGLLERTDQTYANAPAAARFLTDDSDIDLTEFFAFLNAISYEAWLHFDQTVDTGDHVALDLEGKDPGMIGRGIHTFQKLHARMLAEHYDFTRHRHLLDLGGQSTQFAIEAMRATPQLESTFVYTPDEDASVQKAVSEAGYADRATIAGADTVTAEPPGEHDVILVQHCIHRFTSDENQQILRHCRDAATPGARLLIVDFVLDDEPRQRALDAFHGAEYLVIDSTVAYPVADIHDWLAATGWKPVDLVALPGSPRVIVAETDHADARIRK